MYNSDYGELVWENGEVVIKGGQFSKDSSINSKTEKYETGLGFDEADMVPWFYNLNDILPQESTSDLLADISGVTGNDFPSYTANYSTTDNNPVKDSALAAFDNNNGLPPPSFNSRLSSVAGNNSCNYAQASESHGDQLSEMKLQKNQDKKVCDEANGQTIFATGKDLLREPIEKQVIGGNVREDGMDVENIRELEPVAAVPSVCSENSGLRASNYPISYHLKRKHDDEEDCEFFDDSEGDSGCIQKAGSNRNRAAEIHNLTERKRRKKINDKMQALQELIPNCNKADKATMLDGAIDYMRMLQFQVQMMSMRGQILSPPMIPQPGLQQLHAHPHFPQFMQMGIAMGMGYQANTLNTTPGFPACFPAQSNPPSPLWNAAQPFPIPTPVLPGLLTPLESAVTPISAKIPSSKCTHMA